MYVNNIILFTLDAVLMAFPLGRSSEST